jgi:hypothetical protein
MKNIIKKLIRETLVVEFYGKRVIEPITKRFNDSSDDMINKLGIAFQSLFFGVSAFMFIGLIAYIGRVEQISQNAGIEFLKSVKGKDCYVVTHGYKSYAHYFYPELKPSQKPLTDNLDDWKDYALNHKLLKDLYIITKINRTEGLAQYTQLKEIGRKNGFVFYIKPANQ